MQDLKPKILMFGWEFPPHNSGGLGVACHGLTRGLAKNGVDVTFVLPKRVPVNSDFVDIKFAEHKKGKITEEGFMQRRAIDVMLSPYMTQTDYIKLYSKKHGFSHDKEVVFGDTLHEEVLRYGILSGKLAKKENFDVIHAHDWLSFPSGVEAKRVTGKPLITHVHATEFDRSGGSVNQKVFEIEKFGIKHADMVVAVSNHTKNILVKNYNVAPEKIEVVHNGVGQENVPTEVECMDRLGELKKHGVKIVLYAGRLTLQKGVDYFLKAAEQVLKFNPKVLFLISGSGDMEQQLMFQAAAMGISDKVLFAGWLKGADLIEAYRSADVLVMPSISEPFGLIPLEAMMYGTPTLISKQSGVSETITHTLKTDFWDVDEMTDKIIAVLNNKALYEQLSHEGFHEVKKVNWNVAAQKCLSLYNKLCYQ